MIHDWCQWSHLTSHPVLTSIPCPARRSLQEVPHLRRELLMATRHILATDLRKCKFLSHFTYIRMYIHMHIHIRTYMHTYICTYVCTYVHTYAYTYIYVNAHVRTYVPLLRPHFCRGASVSSGICALCVPLCSVFVGVIEQLFDEEVLIGSGWTARETIRCVEPVERSMYIQTKLKCGASAR